MSSVENNDTHRFTGLDPHYATPDPNYMNIKIIFIIIPLMASLFTACGNINIFDQNDIINALAIFSSAGGDETSGNDALSATTNQSDKDEDQSPKLDPLSGTAFVKPPQINNYGTVTLSYPVDVPPGRHGIQPSVGLSYSSSGGDGLAGIGWSLSTGLGVISRTTQNGELYYDHRDIFTFNGQRLVKVEGDEESENGVYRLEIESGFSRFVLSDAESGGVWRVYDKAGTVTVFGSSRESRIFHPEDDTKTYIWNFCRSTDLNGNYMTAEYDDSEYTEDHVLYLKEIRYTGNSRQGLEASQYVRFEYQSRDESYVSKAPGFIMRMDRLLDAIVVGWDDPQGIFGSDTELWRYTMVYEYSEDSGRPLLKTVESTRTTTTPEFIYQPAEHSFVWRMAANPDAGDPEVNPDATQYFEGDFNGDGLSDMVFFNPETGYWKAAEGRIGGGYTFKTYGRRFQGYDGPSKIQWFKGNVTGDYNGDGRSDIAFYLPEIRDFWVAEHDGTVFQFRQYGRLPAALPDIFACEWFPGDFDGNGLSDSVLFDEATGSWYLMRNMGGGFEFVKFSQHFKNLFRNDYHAGSNMDSPSTADESTYGMDRGRVHFLSGDYNGDGRTDISIYDERDGKWWVGENYRAEDQGSGGVMFALQWKLYKVFTAPEQALFGNDRFSGDFNGDGFSDFLLFDRNTGDWIIGETLDDTIRFRIFSRVPRFKEITRWLQGDFNGDGRTDIGFFCAADGNFWIGEATNTGFRYRIYNNLSYGPDPDTVLRTPLPRDEVVISQASAVVSTGTETSNIDYRFNGNYNPGRGERPFAGYFKTGGSPGSLVSGVLFFDRYYNKSGKRLLYKGQGSDGIEDTGISVDLESDDVALLNHGSPIHVADRDQLVYYTKEAGSHEFRLIGYDDNSWQDTSTAEFDGDDVTDFSISRSIYLTGDFNGAASNVEVLVLDDLREAGAQWKIVSGSTVTTLAISGLQASFFTSMRNNRSGFRFFNGKFTADPTGPDQVLMVDMRTSDHRWYLGTISDGSITFAPLSETGLTFPSGWIDGQSRVMEDRSLLLWRTVSDRVVFTKIWVSCSGGCSLTLVTFSPLASGISFKGEFAHPLDGVGYKSPIVHTESGLNRIRFSGTRCELVEVETVAGVAIERADLTDSEDFYVFRWIQGDYNGDGKTDIGIFHLKEPRWYFAVTTGTVPDLVHRVCNGIGGIYTMEYANSTSFDNTGEDGIPHLPMNYKVCTKLAVNDGFNRDIVTDYEYSKGYAFSAFINGRKETDYFGFGEFTVRDALGSATTSWYNNIPYDDFRLNRALAGAVKESVSIGYDGKEYTRTKHEYRVNVIDPGRVDSRGLDIRSYLIEPVKVDKYVNKTLVETRTSAIELTPGKYEMTAKTETVTDRYDDGIHSPVTVTSYSRFENMDATNEMRLDYRKDFSGSPHETTTEYDYDDRGNLVREATGYTGAGLPAVSDKIMRYEYDGYGNRVRDINESGSPARVTERGYDGRLNQFVAVERALGPGVVLTTAYDINYGTAFGGVNKKTDPNGAATYFEYDEYGRLAIQRADTEEGVETLASYSYDVAFPMSGRVTRYPGEAYGSDPVEMRVYADGAGRVLHSVRSATTDAGRRYVKTGRLVYDAVGRVIRKSQTDWADDREIDVFQDNTREKNPTLTEYDSSGRVKKVTLPAGFAGEGETSVTYAYNDPWETIESHSVGRSKRTVKNGRGMVLYVEDSGAGDDGQAVSASIGFAYDIAGNRVKKMDLASTPSGSQGGMTTDVPSWLFVPGVKDTSGNNVAAWRFNAFGQMTESSDPDLGYAGVTYNAFGEAASRIDALGRVTAYEYDSLGRITEKHLPGSEGDVAYEYDSLGGCDNTLGRMVRMDDPAQVKTFSYDRMGRVKRETRGIKGAGNTVYETDFFHDLMGRRRLIRYPEDENSHRRVEVTYSYCPMGVTGIHAAGGDVSKEIVSAVAYNEFGQMTEVRRGNGTVTAYTYDIKGRMESLLTTAAHNGQAWKVQDVRYEFKVDNSIAAVENTPDVDTSGGALTSIRYEYAYDGLNRLVHARGNYEKTPVLPGMEPIPGGEGSVIKKFELGYQFARNGNLTGKTMYEPDTMAVNDQWDYAYANHAATGITTTLNGARFAMQYDAAGNMVRQTDAAVNRAKLMEYDSANRIRVVRDDNTNAVIGRYYYDDQGFRVRKVARREVEGVERDVEVLNPSMYFSVENIGAGSCSVNNIYLNGVRVAAMLPDGEARYYHTDQVDSVKAVTDDAGQVQSRMEYLPFGETWFQEDASGSEGTNLPKYNSQELDTETNFYYYNARHYDPEIGRFVTPDSVIDGELSTQGWNRFAYVHNNPIRYKDPTGHDAQDVLVGVQKAFEKATCEQAKETKAAWNNGRPLKAAYHAANTLGAAIPAFLLPSDRQEADMMALTAGMAPAAIKTGGAGSRLLSAASGSAIGKKVINFADDLIGKTKGLFGKKTDDLIRLAESHITDSGKTVLGHYDAGYIDKAKKMGASYFDVGDKWNKLSEAERKFANKHFIDKISDKGDQVYLSNPIKTIRPGSSLENEIGWLKDNAYQWINQWSMKKK